MTAPLDDRQQLRLLERLAADRDRGGVRELAHYVAMFPDHEHAVASEWRQWSSPTPKDVKFGSYQIVRALGRGGQGTVYEAIDTRLGRRVALKLLDAFVIGDNQTGPPRLLAREVEALTRLEDPRIAGVFEAGVEAGRAFLAMRLVEGPSLRQQLSVWREQASLSLPQRLRLGLEIVRALAAAHVRGVVHRDIKPSNVLLESDQEGNLRPVLIDFGLARAVDSDVSAVHGRTMTGDQIGTPAYMSPERLQGAGHDDPSADVWALGVLLYELATYRAPFVGKTFETVARRIEREEMPTPRPALDGFRGRRDLEALLQCALEKAPARRYADATELAADLELLLAGKTIRARPVGPWLRSLRWCQRHPAYGTILLLLILVAGVSSWAAWRLDASQAQERDARQRATKSLARSQADRGHLLLQSDAPDRHSKALAHLERAARQTDQQDPATLRGDLLQALAGTDLIAGPTPAVGGLGVVKVDPNGTIAAAQSVSPDDRQLHLRLHALAADSDGADRPTPEVPVAPADSGTLLAAHRTALAIADATSLRIVPLPQRRGDPPRSGTALPAKSHGPVGPHGATPFDFARFDQSGELLVAAEGPAWTLYQTTSGNPIANGTAQAPLGELASFSADGRWLVVRHDQRTVFVLDRARSPIKLSFDHPVLQALPRNGERAGLLILQAKPAGVELGIWQLSAPTAPSRRPKPRYRRLTRLAGAGQPIPQLAAHGPWVAAATTSELVVVDVRNAFVPIRCALQTGQAIETMVWRGTGEQLLELELFVQQRGSALQRFSVQRSLDWLQPADSEGIAAAQSKAATLVCRGEPSESSRETPSLQQATIQFPIAPASGSEVAGGQPLGLAVPGLLMLPHAQQTASCVVRADASHLGAALVGVVQKDAIKTYLHVWRQGDASPVYSVQMPQAPGRGAVAISKQARLLAVMTPDGRLQLHNLRQRQQLFELPIPIDRIDRRVRKLAFAEDGSRLLLQTAEESWHIHLESMRLRLAETGLAWPQAR